MRIDVHAHYFPVAYLDLLERFGSRSTHLGRNLLASEEQSELDARFQMMDEAGVALQILSASPQLPYFENEANAIEAARVGNDLYAELVQRHPQRFRAFVAPPLPHIDAAIAELARGLDELGMVGATVTTTINGKSLADPQFEPFFAELERREAVLFVHPAGIGAGEFTQMYGLNWVVGAPFEDTYAALHLVLSGLTVRHPRIKFIIPHLGGTLPILLERIKHQARPSEATHNQSPAELLKRLWYDTISHGSIPALHCACETLGAAQLVLGTDYPYQLWQRHKNAITYIQEAGLPAHDTEAILEQTAARLLQIR